VLDNETGQSLAGFSFLLSGAATYHTTAPAIPDVGTYTSGTHTYAYVPPPNPGNVGIVGNTLSVTLASPLANGATLAMHIDFHDSTILTAQQTSTFTLNEVSVVPTPEPATLAIGGIGLAVLGLVGRLRRRKS